MPDSEPNTIRSRADLLRPSLSETARPAAAPYGDQVGFLSAFFGGPFAAAAMIAINAHRTGRLRRDAWLAAAATLAFLGWLFFLESTAAGSAVKLWAMGWFGRGAPELLHRLLACSIFLCGLLLHRREQRGADVSGMARPNGWPVGLGLIAAGWLLTGWVQDFIAGMAHGH